MLKKIKYLLIMISLTSSLSAALEAGSSAEINIHTRFGVGGALGLIVAPEDNVNGNTLELDHGTLNGNSVATGKIIIGHTYEGSIVPLTLGSSGTVSFLSGETDLVHNLAKGMSNIPEEMKIPHTLKATVDSSLINWGMDKEASYSTSGNTSSNFEYTSSLSSDNKEHLKYEISSTINESQEKLEKKIYGEYKNITTIQVVISVPGDA